MSEKQWTTAGHWDTLTEDGVEVVRYAELTADPKCLRIMLDARRNVTELGYWRDVATGLANLVDELRREQAAVCSLLFALGIPSPNEDGWGQNVMRLENFLLHVKRSRSKGQETIKTRLAKEQRESPLGEDSA